MAHYGTAESSAKAGGSPVTQADHAANAIIVSAIREAYPGDAILSEESKDSAERLDARRVWIVDPLDGTKEFLAQNGEFSIMIGLAVGGEAVLGVVYMPDGDRLYAAARGVGATVEVQHEKQGLRTDHRHWPPRMVGSRSHADPLTLLIRDRLGVTDVVPSGSVGVKCALIAEGKRDLYVHPVPYLKEWDTCAPEVVLREAGGEVTDCMGEPLRYNKPDPRQPDGILACGPAVHGRALETVRAVYSSRPAGHEVVA
jgi:3'(2'), 5'-bisphosphate nucleotidase